MAHSNILAFSTSRRRCLTRGYTTVHLISNAILVSVLIGLWTRTGCPGYSDSYLCRRVSSDFFLNDDPVADPDATDDFTKLIDLDNFTFLRENAPCSQTNQVLLVLVHSAPGNFEKRSTIRSTWGSVVDDRYKLLFLLGVPPVDTFPRHRLDEEIETRGDIVQGNFLDSYRNMTYKHVMALKWTKYFCRNVKFLLKTDDDVFVDLPNFLNYVERKVPRKCLVLCNPQYNALVKRSYRSKWRLSPTEYKWRTYPTTCQGFVVLYSADVVSILHDLAQRGKYFWIDDVFVTGFLTMAGNVTLSSFADVLLPASYLREIIAGYGSIYGYLVGPPDLAMRQITGLWERAQVEHAAMLTPTSFTLPKVFKKKKRYRKDDGIY